MITIIDGPAARARELRGVPEYMDGPCYAPTGERGRPPVLDVYYVIVADGYCATYGDCPVEEKWSERPLKAAHLALTDALDRRLSHRLSEAGGSPMCKFLSAVVTRAGAVLVDPVIDSHEALIGLHGLRDDNSMGHFVRVEFTPGRDAEDKPDYFDLSKYTLRVDEHEVPPWWDDTVRERTIQTLVRTLEKMVINGERKVVVGGAWMIGEEGKIGTLLHGRILAIHPKADLSRANLSRANLIGADLSGSDLSRADLSGAYRTIDVPSGSKADAYGVLSPDTTVKV
jgi:hypothetical protein